MADTKNNEEEETTAFEWNKVGTRFSILWLFKYMGGAKAPPNEKDVHGKTFLQVMDASVAQIHDEHGGLGIPNSFLYWHWAMVGIYLSLFGILFVATTPLTLGFPWMALVHKLVVFFNVWESLGLGVLHGPLHQKFSPPFQDWWYRLTPGTMKYAAPFLPKFLQSYRRNYLDVLVEGVLTYVFSIRILLSPQVTPTLMIPLALTSIYEFVFDYGQHIHTYGTQNMHFFVCMCFQDGQLSGLQLFLTFFYFCSGFCKLGPTFQYMFTSNLLTAKFMVDVPWGTWFRRMFFVDYKSADYRLTKSAWWLATTAASIEMLVPFLTWFNIPSVVYVAIFVFMGMHLFIISTLVIDVYAWNFTDFIWFVILYGVVSTGVDWEDFRRMPMFLIVWFILHGAYVFYGTIVPDAVPYIVAHRHAAGNWSQGVLVIRKTALTKLAKMKSHAGIPSMGPGWEGEWFGFCAFWAYVWNWNLPSRMLVPLVIDIMGDGAPKDGLCSSSGDYALIHSALFFDAIVAHLRFDGLSNVALVQELGRVCDFDTGECTLAWVGAFPSFVLRPSPSASWKVVDSNTGILKEGKYKASDVMDPLWKKPSDLPKTKLLDVIAGKTKNE